MRYKKLIAGSLLAAVAAVANAADVNRAMTINFTSPEDAVGFSDSFKKALAGKTFLDSFGFTIGTSSMLGGALTSKAIGNVDLDISSFNLYSGSTLVASGMQESTGSFDSWSLTAYNLMPGTYSLQVGGKIGAGGGAFGGSAAIAPVPEPETWSMLIGSLAVLGIVGWRRRPRGVQPGGLAA
jgi:hypothetical protein